MLDVNQAYAIAKTKATSPYLISILNFGEDFGFLFSEERQEIVYGLSYILVNKKNKTVTVLPTTPTNVRKIQSATNIPLTTIRIL